MQSRNPPSKQCNTGLYACELTFRIRNKIHRITAIAVKNAVDIAMKTNTVRRISNKKKINSRIKADRNRKTKTTKTHGKLLWKILLHFTAFALQNVCVVP